MVQRHLDLRGRPFLHGEPGFAAFGAVNVNTTSTQALTITNAGSSPLTIIGVSTPGTGFSISDLPILPATLAANGTLAFTVAFTPASAVNYQGNFTVTTDAGSISAHSRRPGLSRRATTRLRRSVRLRSRPRAVTDMPQPRCRGMPVRTRLLPAVTCPGSR